MPTWPAPPSPAPAATTRPSKAPIWRNALIARWTGRNSALAGNHVVQKAKARGHVRELLRLRSEEHTSELQSRENLVCRLLLEKKKKKKKKQISKNQLTCNDTC